MSESLVSLESVTLAKLEQLHNQAGDYIRGSKSDNTWRAYRADWADFQTWCNDHNLPSLPSSPTTVALYLTARASELKVSTLGRRLAAITQMHSMQRHQDPTKGAEVKECWRGIRRSKGIAQQGKAPAIADTLRQMLSMIPNGLIGVRDRALLLIGFAGAFRRSELVSLNVNDLQFTREGLIITLRKSKTDQEGVGRKIGIPRGHNQAATCPVRAVKDWLEATHIKEGPIFRAINRHGQINNDRLTAQTVALVVKRYARAAGLDETIFAGHSLRAGMATSAAMAGATERAIMNQTGHKNTQMVRRYIRDGNLFNENALTKISL